VCDFFFVFYVQRERVCLPATNTRASMTGGSYSYECALTRLTDSLSHFHVKHFRHEKEFFFIIIFIIFEINFFCSCCVSSFLPKMYCKVREFFSFHFISFFIIKSVFSFVYIAKISILHVKEKVLSRQNPLSFLARSRH
jgi:hypothetical protein